MSRLLRSLATGALALSLACASNPETGPSTTWGVCAAHAAPATITTQTASAVASAGVSSASLQALLPRGSTLFRPQSGRSAFLPTIDDASPNTTALALALDVALFGKGLHLGPLGGSLNVTRGQTALHGQYIGLRTLHGRLNGNVDLRVTSGNIMSGVYTADVRFRQLRLDSALGPQTFNGTARIAVSINGTVANIGWTSNVTHRLHDRVITYKNLVAQIHSTLAQGMLDATITLKGTVTVSGMNGITGDITIATTAPLTLETPLPDDGGATATLRSGALLLNDRLTLKVARPDVVALTVDGGAPRLYRWSYLGGRSRSAFAVRRALADTLFQEGRVITMDPKNPQGAALAVMDGRILAVGPTAAVFPFQGPKTRVVSLQGRTLMPGFVEPHAHTNLSALNLLSNVDPRVVPCGSETLDNRIETVLDGLRAAVNKAHGAKALFGFGFDPSRLVKQQVMQGLTLQMLDGVSATTPIVVQNASQHVSYVNSAAFRLSGVWPTAPTGPFSLPDGSPLRGYVVTDPQTGLPTGVINEFAQASFLKPVIGILTETKADKLAYAKQWRAFQNLLASVGVTSYADLCLGAFAGADLEGELLGALALDPSTPCRVRAYLDTTGVDPKTLDIFPGEGDDRVRFVGCKFVSDGSTQGLTAGLSFDYTYPGPYPAKANGLIEFASSDALFRAALPWHRAGWQIAVHANGDRALELVLDTLGRLQKAAPRRDARFRIEHFTVHTRDALQRQVAAARKLGIFVGFTIGHVFYWGQVFHDTLLGAAHTEHLVPVKTLFDAGVPVSTHSDSPVTTPNPLRNVYIATNRLWQATPQQVLNPSEIITVTQALQTITLTPARSMFLDSRVGSLEVGKLADLVLLSADPTTVKPSDIRSIQVLGTWLSGRQVSGATH